MAAPSLKRSFTRSGARKVSLSNNRSSGLKTDASAAAYLPYLNPRFQQELMRLQKDQQLQGRALALAIVARLGDPKESQICGVESLGKVVFDTDTGQGCCSDFSKAWLF